jgi:hypothetical protein
MSVVKVRVEIERELRALLEKRGVQTRRLGIGQMLQELNRAGTLPPSAREFEVVLRVMNDAAHGVEIDPDLAAEAVQVGSRLLQELTRTSNGS